MSAGEASAVPDTVSEFSAFISVLESATARSAPDAVDDDLPPLYYPVVVPADVPQPSAARPVARREPSAGDASAFREVARALAAAESCVSVLGHSSGLMPLAVRDVLRAEMARATALLHLLRFLRGDVSPVRVAVSCRALAQRVLQSVEAERRLRGIVLTTTECADEVWFAGDDALLSDALFGWLIATFALLDGVTTPEVSLLVTARDRELVVSVEQTLAGAPPGWTSRSLDDVWDDEATDIYPAVAFSAGRQIAAAWGARFTADCDERSTSVSIRLPAVASLEEAGSIV